MHLLFQVPNPQTVWYADPITVSTIVIAIATVINVIGTLLLWLTTRRSTELTRDMFEAAHRPYVGMDAITRTNQDEPPEIVISVLYKNFGSVPAHDVKADIRLVADGIVMPTVQLEEELLSVLHPGTSLVYRVRIHEPQEYRAVANAKILTATFICTYKGVAEKQYKYESKQQHDAKSNTFNYIRGSAT